MWVARHTLPFSHDFSLHVFIPTKATHADPLDRRCVGGAASEYPDYETARTVAVSYTVSAAERFARTLLPQSPAGRFRFVFCSAGMAERDAGRRLSFAAATRYLKVCSLPLVLLRGLPVRVLTGVWLQGEAESGLIALEEKHKGFSVFIERPMAIIKESPTMREILTGAVLPSVRVNDLAAVMVEAALVGQDSQVYENKDIARKGKSIMGY